jgi:hypothetical protein
MGFIAGDAVVVRAGRSCDTAGLLLLICCSDSGLGRRPTTLKEDLAARQTPVRLRHDPLELTTSSRPGYEEMSLAKSGGSVMIMTALPYDPEHPPEKPPAGADFMTWTLAHRIHVEHQPGPDGLCLAGTCRAASNPWPCGPYTLARSGFRDACWPGMKPAGWRRS